MRIRKPETVRSWILTAFIAFVAVGLLAGITFVALAYSMLSSGGLMGGDCPDPMSYGSAKIHGIAKDENGNPISGVRITARKAKGVCPQSYEANLKLFSDSKGEFEGGVDVHLGDPDIFVSVSYERHRAYEFQYGASGYRLAGISINVILGRELMVEWSGYSLDNPLFTILTATPTLERSS